MPPDASFEGDRCVVFPFINVESARDASIAALSTEVALLCTKEGTIAWADARAREKLLANEGVKLALIAVPGTEPKLAELLESASAKRVDRIELSNVAETMTEVTALQRESERQRKQLEHSYREILDSNRALVTMHSVLDDKNDELRRASDAAGIRGEQTRTL